jgi:hypothetical protein
VDFLWPFRNFWSALNQEESVSDIRANRIRIERLRKQNFERLSTIKMSLESIGLKAQEVRKEELIKLIYNYYNPRLKTENTLKADTDQINLE